MIATRLIVGEAMVGEDQSHLGDGHGGEEPDHKGDESDEDDEEGEAKEPEDAEAVIGGDL